MSEENVPVQQEVPEQQTPSIDWEARYKGASQKINELMEKSKTLEGQLASRTSEIEQYKTQLSMKDVEKDTSIGEYRKQLEKVMADKSAADKELAELRAMKAKVEVVRELDAPHLMKIIDKIPYVEDPDAMKTIIKDFADWGNEIAKEREKQILAGVTPPISSVTQAKAAPKSSAEWEAHINSLPVGPEREKAWADYWSWGKSQGA
ncbi:MAG TPA: hypothetical protein PKD55_02410 [Bellilinea sp.]|mgnify:CR=1 FL=1|nr:hypothetical protein [Bellilinea sp.]